MRYAPRTILGLLAASACIGLVGFGPTGCTPSKTKPAANTTDTTPSVAKTNAAKKDATAPGKAEDDRMQDEVPITPSAQTTAKAGEAAEKPADAPKNGKLVLGSPELTAGIGVPGSGSLSVQQIEAWLADPKNHEPLDFELPLGLSAGASQIQGIDKNPLTRAKIELGRQLYFDPRLSADVKVSCASCHDPNEGFARHSQFGIGIRDQQGGRNSPVSYNRILSGAQFWDGRAASLEAQAVGPIANPIEMGQTHEACVECLKGVKGYALQFDKIFGRLDIEAVGEAIASFERAIVTGPTPFDYYERWNALKDVDPDDLADDPASLAKYNLAKSEAESHPMAEGAKRGRDLFFSQKVGCTACHVGANLTDEKYHNLGVGMDKEKPDIGREEVTKDEKDRGAFKTPTIRNVAASGPYMHDGSQKTLEEVVEWYAKGGHPNPNLDEKIKKIELSDQDKKDLVEFMTQGCTGDFPKIARDRLPE